MMDTNKMRTKKTRREMMEHCGNTGDMAVFVT